jgi:hypothetical protein
VRRGSPDSAFSATTNDAEVFAVVNEGGGDVFTATANAVHDPHDFPRRSDQIRHLA